IIAVMLPPIAIFFPMFTLLVDLGLLPRIAFKLDNFFRKAGSSGKQALTMCMGFGCNAAGVTGCRIIDSPREKLIAILTNAFIPCNGRFPFLITIASIFMAGAVISGNSVEHAGEVGTEVAENLAINSSAGFGSTLIATITVLGVILLGIFMTLLVSKILSKTI